MYLMYYEWFKDNSMAQAVYFIKVNLNVLIKIGIQTQGQIFSRTKLVINVKRDLYHSRDRSRD